jgi:hypothetical protein
MVRKMTKVSGQMWQLQMQQANLAILSGHMEQFSASQEADFTVFELSQRSSSFVGALTVALI